jgi:hypothetical protein
VSEFIFTVVDITGNVTRSVPNELDEFQQASLQTMLQSISSLKYFSMTVREDQVDKKVYFNPNHIISIGYNAE